MLFTRRVNSSGHWLSIIKWLLNHGQSQQSMNIDLCSLSTSGAPESLAARVRESAGMLGGTEARGRWYMDAGYWKTQTDNNLLSWKFRADSRFAPNQWETALRCNDVSHWLGVRLEWHGIPTRDDICDPGYNICWVWSLRRTLWIWEGYDITTWVDYLCDRDYRDISKLATNIP